MPKHSNSLRQLLLCLPPAIVGAYAILYWCNSHQDLSELYKSLNPYFYRAAMWEADLFTIATKSMGNWWCVAGFLAALTWTVLLWKTPWPPMPKIRLNKNTAGTYSLILVGSILLSLAFNQNITYSSDEVFSALNFAALPIFQTISNYPLPNNHLFFNLINGLLFGWADDLVLTGRVISLFCYLATVCLTWHFLSKWTDAKWLRWPILLVIALQFPVLGFSWQARGYEMVLLFSCLSLGTFVQYFNSGSSKFLPLHAACNMAGIFTLPTYLYWWLGLLLASVLIQIFEKRIDKPYFKWSTLAICGSLILYLPLFSFSGIHSLTANKYVQAESTSHLQFLLNLNKGNYFDGLFSEWFAASTISFWVSLLAVLLPMLLFRKPNGKRHQIILGITFYCIIIAFVFTSTFILRLPYYRNLIAHGYLAILSPIIAVLPYFQSKNGHRFLGAFLLLIAAIFIKKNAHRIPNDLYYYQVSHEFNKNNGIPINIDTLKPIYLDYEQFYWWYVLNKQYPNINSKILWNRPRADYSESQIIQKDSLSHRDQGVYQLIE